MKYITGTTALLAFAAITSLTTLPVKAFTLTQNSNTTTLLNSLLGNTTGLSNFSVSTTGSPEAFGLFENDPFGLGSGIALSTGSMADIAGQNTEDGQRFDFATDLSNDFDIEGTTGDDISLNISFDANNSVNELFFEYVFGSEEFAEFGGEPDFNDSFQLLLNGVNLAKLSDGSDVTISNLVANPAGPYHPDYINNPAAPNTLTKLDGYTKTLTFQGLLNRSARNTLTINLKDSGDGLMDSVVFLKNGSLSTLPPAESVPEPQQLFGLFALAGIALFSQRKHRKTLLANKWVKASQTN
ncbi:choice-of-anchor L domain-containing protein [Ancylothrix sp. C2]|uniref:choice-of-anchor L domain-containing protein n=1 Tax=Ancylothrix sp. D3o TaxID=2953691 RepID=UPI0021BBA46F|nr:choice-of-anchor L domain-containing protein [Ancylothrix sp. D3o]MCT7951398.1 choice-of-anchor L domain-containing protein [Ancylothrix sp. D3o]